MEVENKVIENKELLERIVDKKKQEKNSFNLRWTRNVDSELDKRDNEILKTKEDILV